MGFIKDVLARALVFIASDGFQRLRFYLLAWAAEMRADAKSKKETKKEIEVIKNDYKDDPKKRADRMDDYLNS